MAQLDCFPSAQNLARLEFLNQPAYFVHRVMTLDALLLLFGLAILLADRFPADGKNGMKQLFLSCPLERRQYILGKLLGGFCLAYFTTALFLLCNTAVYALAAPFPIPPREWLAPLGKAWCCAPSPPVGLPGWQRWPCQAWWISACSTGRQPVLWMERRHGGLGGGHALLPAHRWGPGPPAVGPPQVAWAGVGKCAGKRRVPPGRGSGLCQPAFWKPSFWRPAHERVCWN